MERGRRVGSWVVGRSLGRGAMAEVFEVEHAELGSQAALKVLHSTDPKLRARLLREGRAQAALVHPNVVRVHDVLEVDGRPALLMEFVDGHPLSAWMAQRPSTEAALQMLRHIAAGLSAAHTAGLVHRDLKPDNVLVSRDGQPKITDFGIAKLLGGDAADSLQTQTDSAMGTPAYMAPEQIRDAGGSDARADVFALGVIAYELLTGERPFAPTRDLVALYEQTRHERYPPLPTRAPGLVPHVVQAVHDALRGDREARTPDVATFVRALDGAPEARPDGDGELLFGRYLRPEPLGSRGPRRSWRARDAAGDAVHVRALALDQASEDERALFRREGELLRQLDHPGFPAFLEEREVDAGGLRQVVRARRWIDGRSLRDELAERRYTEDEALALLEQASGLLAHLHALRPPVVLRDLSPGSFVRRPDGRLALVDLGAARDALPGTLGGQTIAGRFGYMAPEQFEGEASAATDTWGLGALAVELLGRRAPDQLMDEHGGFQWRDAIQASAPVELLLDALLQPDPALRVADASEAGRAVQRTRQALLTFAERPSPVAGPDDLADLDHQPPVLYEGPQSPAAADAEPPTPARPPSTAPSSCRSPSTRCWGWSRSASAARCCGRRSPPPPRRHRRRPRPPRPRPAPPRRPPPLGSTTASDAR